jgi:hypothetical protein
MSIMSVVKHTTEVKQVELRIREAVATAVMQYGLDLPDYDVQAMYDAYSDKMVMSMKSYIATDEAEPIEIEIPPFSHSYPRDWWEWFKQRWFPKWLLDKYPVKFVTVERPGDTVTVTAEMMYPRLTVPKNALKDGVFKMAVTGRPSQEEYWPV